MTYIISALISILVLTSCSKSFDYKEGAILIETMKKDNRIYSLTPLDNNIWINGKQTSIDKKYILKNKEIGIEYIYRPDYLKSINISQDEFDGLLSLFRKTNAYSVDYKDGKAYFTMDSFLDDSNGFLYSDENLTDANECAEGGFSLNDVSVCSWKKVKPNWYEAIGMH